MPDMSEERFEILGELGRGSRSRVFRALDRRLGREVALKVYRKAVETSPLHDAFLREAQALASIDHPNVVALWGIEEKGDELRIALALVDGEQLASQVRPLPPHRIASIGRDLCAALGSLHGRGLLHRDLRPENVMLRPDGSAVLLDFGVERSLPDAGQVTDFDEFDAPELRNGAPFTASTDLYALARLLLWLGRGRLAEPLAAVVARATHDDPAKRFADAESFSIELAPCLQPVAARPWRHLAAGLGAFALLVAVLVPWLPSESVPNTPEDTGPVESAPQSDPVTPDTWLEATTDMPWRATFAGRTPTPPPEGVEIVRVPEDETTIQDAYNRVADGGHILVAPGEYQVHPLRADDPKSVILQSTGGAAVTGLFGDHDNFKREPTVLGRGPDSRLVIRGFTIAHGNGLETFNEDNKRTVLGGGGVIADDGASIVIEDCIVCSNGWGGSSWGAALSTRKGGSLEIHDSLVVANVSRLNSAVACIDEGTLVASGCTFTRNLARNDNVSMAQFTVLRDATIQLDSCIVWDNASWSGFGRDFTTPSLQADGLGKITVTRSITQTPYAGEGNRAIDPRFVDPDAGDFRLQPGVPWTGVGCFR
jgi:hypothetical protein